MGVGGTAALAAWLISHWECEIRISKQFAFHSTLKWNIRADFIVTSVESARSRVNRPGRLVAYELLSVKVWIHYWSAVSLKVDNRCFCPQLYCHVNKEAGLFNGHFGWWKQLLMASHLWEWARRARSQDFSSWVMQFVGEKSAEEASATFKWLCTVEKVTSSFSHFLNSCFLCSTSTSVFWKEAAAVCIKTLVRFKNRKVKLNFKKKDKFWDFVLVF